MGRKKKEPGTGPTYMTVGFYPEEFALITRVMRRWGITQSAAVRLLVRHGGGLSDPDGNPFTPTQTEE